MALLWLSIVSSAAVVYFDDGNRTLSTSYVLLWLFFGSGFGNLAAVKKTAPSEASQKRLHLYGFLTFAVTAILFFAIPRLAFILSPARQLLVNHLPETENSAVVLGGRRMSGFLVVPDDAALRKDVPTLHFSVFSKIIKNSKVEKNYHQGLLEYSGPTATVWIYIFSEA